MQKGLGQEQRRMEVELQMEELQRMTLWQMNCNLLAIGEEKERKERRPSW